MKVFEGRSVPTQTMFRPLRFCVVLAICLLSAGCILAQSAPAKSGSTAATPSDFSIETEMLTYRALESNSEAIACDIAAYFNKTSANFNSPPAGSVCTVNGGSSTDTVLILPFDRNEFSDFQTWRADMATMSQLENRAEASYQCPKNAQTRAASSTASTAASAAANITPYGAMAQTALTMMAREESASSVVGTIEDQAFMDGVARQLRSLRVHVLMPSAYTSYGFIADDAAHSPFMNNLNKLIAVRACLADLDAKPDTKDDGSATQEKSKPIDKAGVEQLSKDIEAFFASLYQTVAAPSNAFAQAKLATGAASTSTPATGSSPTPPPPEPTRSHLSAALSADGLAIKLGVDLATGTLPNRNDWPHILLVKALESGGSVTKQSNILKTTIRYSGGSVGTYSLFKLDGELECSGNVFDFSGAVPSKGFDEKFHDKVIDPSKQAIFQRGSCSLPSQ